jgi:ribosomal protein S27AE
MNVRSIQGRPALPTILLDGRGYFVDLEARLFRETMDPGRYVDFDSVRGSELRERAGIVTCLGCGASVIVSAALRGARLRCVRCGMTVEERDPSRRNQLSPGSEVV